MPRIKYVGPHDAVEVLGQVVVRGESLEVTDGDANSLLEQPDNWQPVKAAPTKKES